MPKKRNARRLKRLNFENITIVITFSKESLNYLNAFYVMKSSPQKLSFNDFSVVDLFCGVGGLTHGFVKEGFTVEAGIDFDKSCQYAYEKNNSATFLHRDITQLKCSPKALNLCFYDSVESVKSN